MDNSFVEISDTTNIFSLVPKRRQFSLYVPSVDPIYYFPTFDELENFLVPSLPELRAKTKLNISHDEIYPNYYMLQVQYPEESDSSQSISGPVKRRQHLQELLLDSISNNEIAEAGEPIVLPQVLKPPPGFLALPQVPIAEKLFANPISEVNQFYSNNNNPEVSLASPNVHKLSNNTVRTQSTLTLEDVHNSNASTINREEITKAMSLVLKEGNVVIIYLLDHLLKEYLVVTDVSKNLMKFLKKQYVTVALEVLEEMMSDVLEHFNDTQLLKVCNSIKSSVPEFQFSPPRIEQNNSSSSESCLPSSSMSRSSTPNIDSLSPYATPFVPSSSFVIPTFLPQQQSTPVLKMPLTESLIPNMVELKSLSSCNQDNTTSETFPLENSKPCLNKLNYAPMVAQRLPEPSIPMREEPKLASFQNYDTSMYNSKPYRTELSNRFIFKKKLHGNVVHLINLNELIYITISEIQKVTKLKDTNIETIQKNISMCDGAQYLHDVNLTKHVELKEELQRFGLEYDDEILSLIRIEFIPEFFKLFASIIFPKSSFKKFLQEAYYESDDTSNFTL